MASDYGDEKGWGEADSRDFLDYGEYFVPGRETQSRIISSLLNPVPADGHVLDLCCGEGLLSEAILQSHRQLNVHGLDGSSAMIARARSRLSNFADRFDARLFDLAGSDWRTFPWPVAAVVSSLAIHHLDASQKRVLFHDVFHLLSSNGAFVIADIILPASQEAMQIAAEAWDKAVKQRSLEIKGDLDAYERFHALGWNLFLDPFADPGDKPSAIHEQLDWLRDAGFRGVDVFWLCCGHAVYGGFKKEERT